MQSPTLMYTILIGAAIAIIFKSKKKYIYKPLLFFDAIGLGFFTILGVEIGISQDLGAIYCVIIGTITGTFGGVIRDVLAHKVPVIFKKEIYATISILGGFIFYTLRFTDLPLIWVKIIPITFIIISRLIAVRFKLSLPSIYRDEKNK